MDGDGIAAAINAVDSTLRRCVSVPIPSVAALDAHPERALCGASTTAAAWLGAFSPFALAPPPVTPSTVVAAPGGVPSAALRGVDRAVTVDRVWSLIRPGGGTRVAVGGGNTAGGAISGVCPFISSLASPPTFPSTSPPLPSPGGCPVTGQSRVAAAGTPPATPPEAVTAGPVVVASSQMYVPTIVNESTVAGLCLWDVSVDLVHPPDMRGVGADGGLQTRWGRFVYDIPSGVLLTASSHDGGTSVYFNTFCESGEGSTWTSTTVVYERPKEVGAPPLKHPRMSTVWHRGGDKEALIPPADASPTMVTTAGAAAAAMPWDAPNGRPPGATSPLDAFQAAVTAQAGTYGVGIFLVAEPPNADAASELGVLSLSARVEGSSAAVVARLQAALLSSSVVSASALRVGSARGRIGGGGDGDGSGDGSGSGGAGAGGPDSGGGVGRASGVAAADGPAQPAGRQRKGRIRLDDVADEATRRRVVRNRESARRSNERRRLARLAARASRAAAAADATVPASVGGASPPEAGESGGGGGPDRGGAEGVRGTPPSPPFPSRGGG